MELTPELKRFLQTPPEDTNTTAVIRCPKCRYVVKDDKCSNPECPTHKEHDN
jgi:hypothetical protein